MKVKFDTTELQKRVAELGAVIASKPAQPVYGFVRLCVYKNPQGEGFITTLTGRDIGPTLTVFLAKAQAEGPVDILLPFDKLSKWLGNVSVAETTIEATDETKAAFKAGKSNLQVKPHPLDAWPPEQEQPENTVATLKLEAFKELIGNVEFAIPASDGKYTVTVAKLESVAETPAADGAPAKPGNLSLVATDGFRLAIAKSASNAAFELILPKLALELIKKLDGGEDLSILEGDGGFLFQTALESLSISHTSGQFPNYDRVIPKSFKATVEVDKQLLRDAVARVRVCADNEKPIVVFNPVEGALGLSTSSADASTAEGFINTATDEVEAVITGEPIRFGLDADKLVPFLDRAYGSKTGKITIRIKQADNVIDFLANEENYRFLQMPVQI